MYGNVVYTHFRQLKEHELLTEDEAKQVIRAHGWTPHVKPISRGRYLYAARKRAGKVKERYICPISRLERMTEETIVAKLL